MTANLPRLTGADHPAWKGGRYLNHGYVYVVILGLPSEDQILARAMTSRTYIAEHRLIMAKRLCRPLAKTELVHHLNGIKHDNNQGNLVLDDRASHSRLHREIEMELRRLRDENLTLRSLLGLSPTDSVPTLSKSA